MRCDAMRLDARRSRVVSLAPALGKERKAHDTLRLAWPWQHQRPAALFQDYILKPPPHFHSASRLFLSLPVTLSATRDSRKVERIPLLRRHPGCQHLARVESSMRPVLPWTWLLAAAATPVLTAALNIDIDQSGGNASSPLQYGIFFEVRYPHTAPPSTSSITPTLTLPVMSKSTTAATAASTQSSSEIVPFSSAPQSAMPPQIPGLQ